ncbi:MarR family transcriptional regulator [Crystallibacter degradans]|uniref:MarR family transcriptional regulator n=1 Tax=Crystallibacter degradans TaxID=2726743 RepID=UPI001473B2F0|nr:MarR family transcriptional regulator [Arthrobacter sp. SF27]NMR32323.1 MarR family transcriptional regulator [Arthrobacter sp. SF27]
MGHVDLPARDGVSDINKLPRSPAEREQAEAEWRALASLLASQPRVRLSKDGGKTYKDSGERDLTDALPSLPAAVRTCGTDGLVRTICLDLDTSRGGQDKVDSDYNALCHWFSSNGVRWIEDQSPSGGRHLYLPLNFGVAFTDAKEFVQAAAKRFSSIDPGPHENAKTGAIRVPGSVWKKGGFQRLTMSLNIAYDIARRNRNNWTGWSQLRESLVDELAAVRQRREEPLELLEPAEALHLAGGPRALPALKEYTARSGNYDTTRYSTPSEARQGVMASAVAAGWSLTDVQRRMNQNIWAGMVAFYSRYSPSNRRKALQRDWRSAVKHVESFRKKPNPSGTGNNNGYKSYTSPPNTHPPVLTLLHQPGSPAEYQYLLTWRNALRVYEESVIGSRSGLGYRMLLRAIGEAAHKRGSRFIEFGVRSLAIATGTHETTVARQLRELSRTEAPMIRLAQEGRGLRGDLYELVIPDEYRTRADAKAWRPGKIHALRPVFRELGVASAFVYEAIERADGELISADIARTSGLSPKAVTQALELMAAWNMISRIAGRWHIVKETSLRTLAEYFGVLEAIGRQMQRYRSERVQWLQWLLKRALSGEPILAGPNDDYPYWQYGPPEDEQTIGALLYAEAS